MKTNFFSISSIKRLLCGGAIAAVMSCNTLDLKPEGQLTLENILSDYNGFLTYSWQFYNAFNGYTNEMLDNDLNSDLLALANPNGQSQWIWQQVTIPTAANSYSRPYANLRTVNLMLDYIDKSSLNEVDRVHWRCIGYFFRAYNYTNLINLYGDVPYVDKPLNDQSEELLVAHTPRDVVAANILKDLQYAEANLKNGDGENTVNVHVVRALLSRFGLREGTWRKYHNLAGANTYLQASFDASAKLMVSFPALNPNYDLDFNSVSLAGVPGIILYKAYVANQVTHGLSTQNRNSSGRYDLTKAAADMFLMTDGQTRFTSPLFQGDKSAFTEFRNRDRRLYYCVPPPFTVVTTPPSLNFTYTSNPVDTSYFGIMRAISDPTHKTLPTRNWNGFVVRQEPHYVDFPNGQPYSVTYTGYRFYKYYNQQVQDAQGQDISDSPIFRMGEVLANHAEAAYELGLFNQAVADATVNKLRARGAVAPLNVTNIPNDPTRDQAVNPVLWEIRRERSIELIGEGFRFDDLRRWKKMEYAVREKLGRYITKGTDVPANSIIPIQNGASAGYISYLGVPPGPFPEHYYLYPIPSNQIVLNPKITQNPGWK
ncbi:RagB/SusD family nutrient uptake outer membrane protein [Pedobacter yulinensis]|uniref:RagB/SusD family nutrient uptake outer membrane protein n=1 Tax=Pedobacter yulinensis TaxID=2126353 RepID=A0A2T3HHW7_9SPHI|nr:RagB/SusD family nutrient uptake outer membrane protein [Pedobacter yulinensis]PST82038.1 RagB/SusD family nutrient uptake outer membrane protein [Pedobacter yulinensis]